MKALFIVRVLFRENNFLGPQMDNRTLMVSTALFLINVCTLWEAVVNVNKQQTNLAKLQHVDTDGTAPEPQSYDFRSLSLLHLLAKTSQPLPIIF